MKIVAKFLVDYHGLNEAAVTTDDEFVCINTQVIESKMTDCNQAGHLDMPFCDSLSIIVYLSGVVEGVTRFLPLTHLGPPLSNNFTRNYLLNQNWHVPCGLPIELKVALQRRFSCVFEASSAAVFHEQFINPMDEILPVIDTVADENINYQICVFRPDIFHLGARVRGRPETRFVLFSSIRCKAEVELDKPYDYDLQFHPAALFMAMQPTVSAKVVFFDPTLADQRKKKRREKELSVEDVKKMFDDFLDNKNLILDVKFNEDANKWELTETENKKLKTK
jgi:hypothetical protein